MLTNKHELFQHAYAKTNNKYKKLGCRWQTARRICVICKSAADYLKTRPSPSPYNYVTTPNLVVLGQTVGT